MNSEMDNKEVVLIEAIDNTKKKQLEKLLLKNNISYYERSKGKKSFFGGDNEENKKYTIYVHMDSLQRAQQVLEELT